MSLHIRNSKSPRWSAKYQKSKNPCKEIKSSLVESVYGGTGVEPKDHPLNKALGLDKVTCDACESKAIKVLYAKRQVHMQSGDEYYDYEVKCDDCASYTQVSFADND